MSEAPRLSRRDLEEALKSRYGAETAARASARRTFVAYFGTGAGDVVATPIGDFEIVPVRSELELRDLLLKAGPEERKAFLVPWAGDLPLDLAGRFSGNGRVIRIGAESRLCSLFGVKSVDAELRDDALAQYLLRRTGPGTAYALGAGRLTKRALYEAWLGRDLGIDVQGGLGLDMLLAWAAQDARGPQVATSLTSDAAAGVRERVLAFLEGTLGAAAPLIWKAWEAGRGRAVLELALLFEPTVSSQDGAVRYWLRTTAKQELGCTDETAHPVAEALAKAAGTALRSLEQRAPEDAASVLKAADARPLEPEVRAELRSSPRLLSAWTMRLDRLGEALQSGVAEPARPAVEVAREALHELERHACFRDANNVAEVKRAEMALRLLSWLAAWKARPVEPSSVPQRDAEELGAWYVEEGGFVDWARGVARGGSGSAFGRGVGAVVAAADAVRAELDGRFARSLARWVESARPAERVVPIEQVLKRVGVKFLDGNADRSLLVLLVDGMAWAQAVELLQSLGQSSWGPLAWHVKEGNFGRTPYPVVFAGLPTVTDVSRAEFFGGKLLPAGESGNTTKDPERFAAHRDLKKYVPDHDVPRLLLRGESHTGYGSASEEALSQIAEPTRRIVGIVVNAIDDSLKSSTQQVLHWTVDSIRSLRELLDAARARGRSVLVASDHGHVPGGELKNIGPIAGGGARWRPWREGDETREHEVGFVGTGVHAPKGAKGVILLADEVSRYGSAPHSGEHGGATLAEVVAPCFLIGPDEPGFDRHDADKALIPKPASVPEWWQFEVWSAHEPVESERPKAKPRTKVPESQIALPMEGVSAPPPSAPPPSRKPTPKPGTLAAVNLDTPLAKSELLASRAPKAEQRRLVVAAVQYLLDRNGVASGEAFAAALGTLPYRVQGLVSTLQETLNVDGYAVLSYDTVTRTVRLEKDMLFQQFGVEQ